MSFISIIKQAWAVSKELIVGIIIAGIVIWGLIKLTEHFFGDE